MSSSQTEYSHKQTVPHTPLRTRRAHKPFGLFWRSHTLFIVSTVIIGLFSETFLYGIAVPILPFLLEDRIGINHDELQTYSSILLAVYSASSIIISPIAGVIADKTASRKLPFMFGLVLLIIVRNPVPVYLDLHRAHSFRSHPCSLPRTPSLYLSSQDAFRVLGVHSYGP